MIPGQGMALGARRPAHDQLPVRQVIPPSFKVTRRNGGGKQEEARARLTAEPVRVVEHLNAVGIVTVRDWCSCSALHEWWLVLLACLRGTGVSQAQVPWQTSLAAFAFVRLLTALPVTPGGLGITELGLIGTLTASADHRVGAQVTAAVLLYRAVTYLPPIPLGALACLVWRHAPALIHASPHHTEANHEIVSRN
jgi:hypothetical protein